MLLNDVFCLKNIMTVCAKSKNTHLNYLISYKIDSLNYH